jgi:hypothetical protein
MFSSEERIREGNYDRKRKVKGSTVYLLVDRIFCLSNDLDWVGEKPVPTTDSVNLVRLLKIVGTP